MATTEADCSAILDVEAAFGRRLVQIGFMRRFDAQYRAMKETIQKGAIGSPLMFHSVHRNAFSPGHFKATMAITDTAVHDIDIARFVLDDEPVAIAVKAPRGNQRAGGVADPLFTLMDMRSGALVTIETSVHIAYGYDIRGEVIGETGTVSLAEQNEVVLKTNGSFSGRVFADWPERFDPAFDAEFRAWISAAAQGRRSRPERVGWLCRDRRHARRREGARERRPGADQVAGKTRVICVRRRAVEQSRRNRVTRVMQPTLST